ncbi:GNAT family N-acetyltransferase [Kibdelosporangium philippinense]|uniref:GNAT family N-acetyltransferase n=1 Tax=Kibdelosporangium philippinense TaxID=211113 RepID=A0ABS8YZS8_9PSEU|nr:GNAT family N-acetyltransferase [Kibdelosporangium philippinense]MCE7001244.1 GNAT family N-acetyltransferase [Kibdelosporangium philippinense]
MTVRTATTEDLPEVGALLAASFHKDPVSIWLFPDEDRRAAAQPPFFKTFAMLALESGGSISLREDGLAATVWFPSSDDEEDVLSYFDFLTDEELKRFGHLAELMAENHPDQGEHQHLQFIAVHPDRQRLGVGGALLAHDLANLDGVPAYLEASSEFSPPLYQRFGFEHIGTPFGPDPQARMYPMWRKG